MSVPFVPCLWAAQIRVDEDNGVAVAAPEARGAVAADVGLARGSGYGGLDGGGAVRGAGGRGWACGR